MTAVGGCRTVLYRARASRWFSLPRGEGYDRRSQNAARCRQRRRKGTRELLTLETIPQSLRDSSLYTREPFYPSAYDRRRRIAFLRISQARFQKCLLWAVAPRCKRPFRSFPPCYPLHKGGFHRRSAPRAGGVRTSRADVGDVPRPKGWESGNFRRA